MFIMRGRKRNFGFTLVELAIVLGVTGVLFVGLYRLLSGGNAQLKDSSVASQQLQLISSVKGFLATGQGQAWMGLKAGAPSSTNILAQDISLPLPPPASAPDGVSNSACHTFMALPANDPSGNLGTFCDNLPAGFSSATINAYGQTYAIQVQTGLIAANATVPTAFSFMIVTAGGDTIQDADGGRIASQIGSDGGFIYATANVCNAQACGSYGAWQANLTGLPAGFNFANSFNVVGHVVSRTYVSAESNSGTPWLARFLQPGESVSSVPSPLYETMQTALFLGGQTLFMANNNNIATPQASLSTNAIYLQGTPIIDQQVPQSNKTELILQVQGPFGTTGSILQGQNLVVLTSNCSVDQPTASGANIAWHTGDTVGGANNVCTSALQISGDENVNGLLQAVSLFSGTFIYQGSDARIKTNIQPVTHALDAVMQMKPVSYALKAGGQKGLGFVAQDMEKIYPDLVMNAGDSKGMKAINYDGLIAPLVEAVQELKQQNDELRHELHEQMHREQELESKLNQKTP
jgi:type II secretory pathway pseudopilin PulG